MKTSKKLSARIKAYSAMGGALLGADATASIVYTDISPDFNGGGSSSYLLDLNNDAVNDFEIFSVLSSSSYYALVYIKPLTAGNAVVGSLGTFMGNPYAYPYALNNGANIGQTLASGNWQTLGTQSMLYYTLGNWAGAADKFLGLRLTVGSNTYYGWCRMDVNTDGTAWVVKDYAYEDVANTTIQGGAMGSPAVKAHGASNITAADVGNALDGTDLEVSFNKGTDETTVASYRAMAVKSANAATFDVTAAQAVSSGNYLMVAKSGSATYTQAFPAAGNDVDGDPIAVGQPYKIFVLSVADGTNATADSLAGPSSEVTLINDIGLNEFLPNPAEIYGFEKTVIVDLQRSSSPKAALTIIDMRGNVIYKDELITGSRYDIPMEQFSSGVYVASLKLDSEIISKKIVLN